VNAQGISGMPGVNVINLHAQIPKAQKIQSSSVFFALFGSTRVKALLKTMVKSTPDFGNFLRHVHNTQSYEKVFFLKLK